MSGLNYGSSYKQRGKIPVARNISKRAVKATCSETGDLVGEYESIDAAAGELGVPNSVITSHCKKNRSLGINEPVVYLKGKLIFTYNEKTAF